MFKIEELTLFVAVIEAQSITAGAEKLGLPKSNVSRRLKQLEESLQVKLIERTSRIFKPTQAGALFYKGAIELLESVETLSNQVNKQQTKLSGRVRICGPSALTHLILPQCITEFSKLYPNIQLEFLSGGHKRSLQEDNIDLQLTIDHPKDSSLIAAPIMKVRTYFYAGPQYLQQHGTPTSPEQLSQHKCIGSLNQGLERVPWKYLNNGKYKTLNFNYDHSSDSAQICRDMVELGMGVAQLPEFVCRDGVKLGKIVQLFDDSLAFDIDIYAIYSSRTLLPMKTRVLLEHLKTNYQKTV